MTTSVSMETALEVTHGVEPLDRLLAALDSCADEWSQGGALYGPGGVFDALRKARLSTVALAIRDERQQAGEKATEALIDQIAHAHPDYTKWLDTHTANRANWLAMDAYRQGVWARINRGQAMLRVAAMERNQ